MTKPRMFAPSFFELVGDFHKKFGLPLHSRYDFTPDTLDQFTFDFRLDFMREELEEFYEAYESDLPHDQAVEKMADALVDLVYVALGTAHMMDIPFNELFAEVHRANMTKERALSPEHSKASTGRGHHFDVVKPPGWQPPNLGKILWPNSRSDITSTEPSRLGSPFSTSSSPTPDDE